MSESKHGISSLGSATGDLSSLRGAKSLGTLKDPEIERKRLARGDYGPGWRALSIQIKERDNWTCVWCGAMGKEVGGEAYLETDHIVELSDGGSNHPTNLQTLCKNCHADKSQITAKARGRPHRGSRSWIRPAPPERAWKPERKV